jgi:hypothetical protein
VASISPLMADTSSGDWIRGFSSGLRQSVGALHTDTSKQMSWYTFPLHQGGLLLANINIHRTEC